MLVKRLEGASRGVLGRVQKRDVSFEHEIALVILGADLLPCQLLGCHRQNAEAVVAEAVVLFLQSDDQIGVHRRHLPVEFEVRALVEDLFRSALGEEDRFAFGILHQHRHHAPREVERDLVQLLVLLDQRLLVEVGAIQNRPVEQVLEAGLEVADQVAIQKHLLGFSLRRRCNAA